MVQFFVGDSIVYRLSINKDEIKLKSIANRNSLAMKVDALNELKEQWVSGRYYDDHLFEEFVLTMNGLYEILMKDMIDDFKDDQRPIDRLVVVADDILSYVPFEMMLIDSTYQNLADYSSLKYLIKDYAVSYSHSAKLFFKELSKGGSMSKSFLGYAPTYASNVSDSAVIKSLGKFRNALTPLEWNHDEIKTIGEYIDGKLRYGEKADETTFKKEVKDYDIVHLAMHAMIDDDNPMLSKLVFNRNEKDSINDGYLHTYELFNIQLNPKLVVLSACNTGVGKYQKGAGLSSLGYAFAFAGCSSIVMSKWKVDDRATQLLMSDFYANLSEGMDKAKALRAAKLNLMHDPSSQFVHPMFWAGFVLIGDSAPIFNSTNYLLWIILIAIVLAGSVWAYIQSRKRLL